MGIWLQELNGHHYFVLPYIRNRSTSRFALFGQTKTDRSIGILSAVLPQR